MILPDRGNPKRKTQFFNNLLWVQNILQILKFFFFFFFFYDKLDLFIFLIFLIYTTHMGNICCHPDSLDFDDEGIKMIIEERKRY